MIRTTVRLEEDLFKDARKKAIDRKIAFADIVNEALSVYLGKTRKPTTFKMNTNQFLQNLEKYHLKGGPKDLAKKHDKYTWE